MPERKTRERARQARREGKSPSTQAGEFVREEIHHIREGKHGARSAKQAIAIGLSKARRAGVRLRVPQPGSASKETRAQAKRDLAHAGRRPASARRSRASVQALRHEGRSAASSRALARHARSAARRRRSRRRRGA